MTENVFADHDVERGLLSACMWSKTAREEARKAITGQDFYEPSHEAIWDAMSRLDRHGKTVDMTTVAAIVPANLRRLVAEVGIAGGLADAAADYAAIIRSKATRRRIHHEAQAVVAAAANPAVDTAGLAAKTVTKFAGIRDSGVGAEDITGLTLAELLEQEDDQPDWLIPDLLERRDRFMLTGVEGLGKSHLLRQFALHASAGLNPFDPLRSFAPVKAVIIDCENTWGQVRRKLRPMAEWLNARAGTTDPRDRVVIECTSRMEITRDKDLSRIHQLLDSCQPDIVAIGPLYRLTGKAIQTDDEAAPVLAALDTIRDRGCAVLIEAHAGHAIGKGGQRDLRPRGSSALLGWPEFGFGLRDIGTEGYADMVQWRGPREEREWPQRLRKADGFRWIPHGDLYGYDRGMTA